mgnify:FL=1
MCLHSDYVSNMITGDFVLKLNRISFKRSDLREVRSFCSTCLTLLAIHLCLLATPLKAQTAYNAALDIKNLEFKSLGADFSTVSEEEAIGGSALASNPTADNGKTALSLTVNGPLNGSFRWKVSSEYLFDKLVFRIDGSEVDFISGLRRWKTKSFSLSSGEHTLEWSYEKDGNNSKHADRGWVDYLVLVFQFLFTLSVFVLSDWF